jgi:hypothetical protein
MKRKNEKVRPWAYRIWTNKNGQPLVTRMPKDGNQLEGLIEEHGEMVVAVAWASYVIADPPVYNLAPVTVVHKWTNPKNGRQHVDSADDESAITKFPLASFLKVSDGYIQMAKDTVWKFNLAVEAWDNANPATRQDVYARNFFGVNEALVAMDQKRE